MVTIKISIFDGFYSFFYEVARLMQSFMLHKLHSRKNYFFNFSDGKSLLYPPNGHIFVDSPSIRRRNSSWKVRGNCINFERRIHVEIMTSTQRGNFDVDSTFKIGEISMSSLSGFFYVVSTSNRHNFCFHCFHSIIF